MDSRESAPASTEERGGREGAYQRAKLKQNEASDESRKREETRAIEAAKNGTVQSSIAKRRALASAVLPISRLATLEGEEGEEGKGRKGRGRGKRVTQQNNMLEEQRETHEKEVVSDLTKHQSPPSADTMIGRLRDT